MGRKNLAMPLWRMGLQSAQENVEYSISSISDLRKRRYKLGYNNLCSKGHHAG